MLLQKEFRELYLCQAWTQVEHGVTIQMKSESISNEEQITKALYKDYSQFNYFTERVAECRDLSAQITATDNEIDNRVFDLYGLTEDERRIVTEG